jgi:two-component system sensor histidine kinase UhpB
VRVRRAGPRVELTVSDDGRGFSFDDAEGGLGIAGMRERALLVGGEVEIESRPGTGTTVRLTV